MDEDFLWMDMAQQFERLTIVFEWILACANSQNNKMKQLNWSSPVKALYEHCISTEISELNLFVN